MATSTKAELVAGRELSNAIDKAVALAAQRHGIAVSDKNLIINWELIGRLVKDRALADKFSDDVAATLTKGGIAAQPSTLRWGKQILCGFFEKARIPQLRDFR